MGSLLSVFAGKIGKLMAFGEALSGPPIGTVQEVKAAVARIFPQLQWKQHNISIAGVVLPKSDITDWSWSTLGAPEISLGADAAGDVKLLKISRAERSEVKTVARALGLRVFDEQSMEMFGG